MIETPSPLENLSACAISYLAGILFTLVLISYIDAAVAGEHTRGRKARSFPNPDSFPDRTGTSSSAASADAGQPLYPPGA